MENIMYSMPIDEFISKLKEALKQELVIESTVNNDQKRIRTEDVARLLSVSTKTIKNWRDSGKLPFERIGRTIYFKESDLIKILEQSRMKRRGIKY